MSGIPLVQDNEKDSINTSIIAIKRALERINQLLGLSDSGGSNPDLSGLDMQLIAWCTTAGATASKIATADGYTLKNPSSVILYLENTNTAVGAITLDINDTGAKTIRINGTVVTSSSAYIIPSGFYIARYTGTYWDLYNIINMSEQSNFGTATGSIDAPFGALRVKKWYFSTEDDISYIQFENGLKIQWGWWNGGTRPIQLPLSYTAKEAFVTAVAFQGTSDGSVYYREFLKPYDANHITEYSTHKQYWITIGH